MKFSEIIGSGDGRLSSFLAGADKRTGSLIECARNERSSCESIVGWRRSQNQCCVVVALPGCAAKAGSIQGDLISGSGHSAEYNPGLKKGGAVARHRDECR